MTIRSSLAVAALLAIAPGLSAQAPGPSTTVIGVVVDSLTGAPIGAARVSVGLDGRAVASNTLGRFSLTDVPIGMRRIVVTRLGYEDREVVISITDPMGGVQVKLMPEPFQIEGLSTKAATEGDLRGRVVDAETGEPVPFARVVLTRDAVNQVGRRMRFWSTDTLGYFLLPDIQVGGYLLKVERPGYSGTIVPLSHEVPGPPVQISLARDHRRGAALGALMMKLDARAGAYGKSAILGEEHLQTAKMPFLDQFLMHEGPLNWGNDIEIMDNGRLRPRNPPILYIDGYVQIEPQATLEMYSPKEFYRIEFIECRLREVWVNYMFAYTYQYIEDRMLNPNKPDPQRDPLGTC